MTGTVPGPPFRRNVPEACQTQTPQPRPPPCCGVAGPAHERLHPNNLVATRMGHPVGPLCLQSTPRAVAHFQAFLPRPFLQHTPIRCCRLIYLQPPPAPRGWGQLREGSSFSPSPPLAPCPLQPHLLLSRPAWCHVPTEPWCSVRPSFHLPNTDGRCCRRGHKPRGSCCLHRSLPARMWSLSPGSVLVARAIGINPGTKSGIDLAMLCLFFVATAGPSSIAGRDRRHPQHQPLVSSPLGSAAHPAALSAAGCHAR